MKKILPCLFLFTVLLISCTSTSVEQKNQSYLSKIGKEGDVVISVKSSSNKVDRINIAYSSGCIEGCVEGSFNKLEGLIASSFIKLDFDSLNYYQKERGVLVFSTDNAKSYGKSLTNNSGYIDEIDIQRMLDSDIAVFSRRPLSSYPYLDKMILLINGNICNAELKAADEKKANGLFAAIKSSYISYLTKNRIKIDYDFLSKSFKLLDNTVYIYNLPVEGFITNFVEEFLSYGK